MDPAAVALVLAAAVLHALWNVRLHGPTIAWRRWRCPA
jgi:hypothetical protein